MKISFKFKKINRKKIPQFYVPILLIAVTYFAIQIYETKKAAEAKGILQEVYAAEAKYKKEFGAYSNSLREAGWSTQVPGYSYFLDISQLSTEEISSLPSDFLPFVKQNAYQIILKINREKKVSYWLINEHNQVSQLRLIGQ